VAASGGRGATVGREALGEQALDGDDGDDLITDFSFFFNIFFWLEGLSSKDRVYGFSFGELGHVDLTGGS
jgi:hypothetical protein